jgi:hypothetical protein
MTTGGMPVVNDSKFDLLGQTQCVIDFNSEVTDSTLQLCMSEKELHGAKVAGFAVNLGGLRAPHRVGAIEGRLQADAFDPAMH